MTRTESGSAVLTDRLGSMTADGMVKLVRELCARLDDGTESFHGNIWPGNVFLDREGYARLGKGSDAPASNRTADQVEFIAPEFFWQSDGSPASDVYSLGLLLYAGCQGSMPFQPEGGPVSDKARATALQRRLKGEPVGAPRGVSPELGAVIRKALAYEPDERYASAAELLRALGETDEALPLSVPAAPERDGARRSVPAEPVEAVDVPVRKYTVRKDFEGEAPIPVRRRKPALSPVITVLCVAAVAVIGVACYALLSGGSGQTGEESAADRVVSEPYILPAVDEEPEQDQQQPPSTDAPTPSLGDDEDPERSPGAEEESDGQETPAESAPPEAVPTDAPTAVGTLTVTSKVNLRSGPGTDFEILGVADVGTLLRTSGVTQDGKWYRVTYNGAQAYVNRRLVSVRDFTEVSAESGSVRVVSAANIRSGPGTGYDILGKADVGASFTVTGQTDTHWYQIVYNGATAYIAGNLVEK